MNEKYDKLRKENSRLGRLTNLFELYNRIKIYEDRIYTVERLHNNAITHTYRDFTNDVEYLATFFTKNHIHKQRIAIIAKNSYNWIVSFFAITCTENIAVPIDKELTEEEINIYRYYQLLFKSQ